MRHLAFGLLGILVSSAAAFANCLCLVCAFDPKIENFIAVTESMAPAIIGGECSVMQHVDPETVTFEHGQVIGFKPVGRETVFIFRIMALGGDTVEMRAGRVILNGDELPQVAQAPDVIPYPNSAPFPRCKNPPQIDGNCIRDRATETTISGRSYDVLDTGLVAPDTMPAMHVPDGFAFVMGDHRDNAADSRMQQPTGVGLVPLSRIVGVFNDL